ncbi:hydroxymethylbilane synthase [SAR86 cluster bacterium]|nr:hydroxymethylbilane synthase [SAR86 cluster bacterium]
MKNLRIISRKSNLAKIQAKIVGDKILNIYPDINIEYLSKETQGDIDLTTPLSKMPAIGVFTNDIRNELITNKADIAVHSWKDLPVEMETGTDIYATIERGDLRDILLFKKTSVKKKNINILTSSPRRSENLSAFLPMALPSQPNFVNFLDVRGNIATRIEKLIISEADGLVIAKVALDRIFQSQLNSANLEKEKIKEIFKSLTWMILPLSKNPSAPAQGALAIEARSDDEETRSLLGKINDRGVFLSVSKERQILKNYGGGCHQKIGVSCESLKMGEVLTLKGLTENGEILDQKEFSPHQKFKNQNLKGITNFYPEEGEKSLLFDRNEISESVKTIESIKNSGIYVSRANALPKEVKIDPTNIIWTSGIETWENLAKLGLWVNGSSDSLGEEQCEAENILGNIKWYKLTHNLASQRKKEIISTYELIEKEIPEKVAHASHFYWMSASSFKYALKKKPEIENANHACGMGRTFDEINTIIPGKVYPYLKYKDWLDKIRQAK